MELEEIRKRIFLGKPIEEILQKFDWKSFEQTVGDIFSSNGYRTFRNFRFKTKRRYEIDIIAVGGPMVFCVDCKEWGKGRNKNSGLKSAVAKQEKRVKEFMKFTKINPIARSRMRIGQDSEFIPLIVTLLQEDLRKELKTLIVPVWKLNSFLVDSERYV